jgi:RNA polymerase sigma-70 factor (ECF subfamily)
MSHEDILARLLDEHGHAIRRIARAYAGAAGEADDLFQEILAQAWRSLPTFRGDSGAGTWLYRVALNTALTWKRRTSRHRIGRVALDPSRNGFEPSSNGSPRSERAILEDFLGSLGGGDHTVLVLYMEGLSYQEIADVTGLSVSAVGVRIHRLKQAFTDRYVER